MISIVAIKLFSILLIVSQIAANQCTPTGPCRCNYESGFGYDLQALEKTKFDAFKANTTGIKYMVQLCNDSSVPDYQAPANECNGGYAICLYNASVTDKNFTLLANNKDAVLKVDSDDASYLVYTHESKVTTISLVCTNVDRDYLLVDEKSTDQDNFVLFSKHACKQELFTVSTLSTGAVFNITLLVIVFVYLTLGILVDYFLMGARGIEVIPHLAFWRDFPSLVRDGVKFVQNGCKIQPSDLSENRDIYTSI